MAGDMKCAYNGTKALAHVTRQRDALAVALREILEIIHLNGFSRRVMGTRKVLKQAEAALRASGKETP